MTHLVVGGDPPLPSLISGSSSGPGDDAVDCLFQLGIGLSVSCFVARPKIAAFIGEICRDRTGETGGLLRQHGRQLDGLV